MSDFLKLEAGNLDAYFTNLFNLALVVGAILSVLIIASAGLQYMTTDAVSGKGESKGRIWQAILGLLMLLSVWIFFKEINPNILNLDLTLETLEITGSKLDTTPPPQEPSSTTVGGFRTALVETENGTFPEWQARVVDRPSGAFDGNKVCANPPDGYRYFDTQGSGITQCPHYGDGKTCCRFKLIE